MGKKEEKSSKIQEALDKLNKTYGKGTILSLDSGEPEKEEYDVISSGSIGFDYIALDSGGFVKGKLYELMGWEGVGKSTICGHVAANCQKKQGKVLYIDGEHALDKEYFKKLGVNTNDMLISQPDCGEQGFNIALEMINTGEIDLIIIDSDSSLIPQKQLDGDVGDSTIGYKARLNSNAYPKLKSALAKNNVLVIVVSQYREKIGVMFGNPTTTQGGHALKFYSDCRVEISKSQAKDGDVIYGNVTKIKTTKNKMGRPFRKADFEIVYGKGIDRAQEVIALLHELEIGKKWGKIITVEEEKLNLEEFYQQLSEDDVFYAKYKQLIINKIKELN